MENNNKREEKNLNRFAEAIIVATSNGRSVRQIGRTGLRDLDLNIAGMPCRISRVRLALMSKGDVLIIGRWNPDIKVDISLARNKDGQLTSSGPGMVDNRVSRIQCVIRREERTWVIYDCGINGTELVE